MSGPKKDVLYSLPRYPWLMRNCFSFTTSFPLIPRERFRVNMEVDDGVLGKVGLAGDASVLGTEIPPINAIVFGPK